MLDGFKGSYSLYWKQITITLILKSILEENLVYFYKTKYEKPNQKILNLHMLRSHNILKEQISLFLISMDMLGGLSTHKVSFKSMFRYNVFNL